MDARISTSGLTASANAPAKAGASPPPPPGIAPRSYAISGKIMLSAIVSLLAVVVLVLCLHIYSRWYFLRLARRRRLARAFARRAAATAGSGGGLEPDLIKSLPVFTYSPEQGKAEPGSTSPPPPPPECAVCLCDFEKRDQGRVLPACSHVFHAECIDMWFQTHSTCPLCRAPVQRITANKKLDTADGRSYEQGAKSAGTPASTSSSASGSPDSTSSMARCLPDLDFRTVRADRNLHVDLERGEAVPEPTPPTANRTASKTRTSSS